VLRFEYLVAHVRDGRVWSANDHWQGSEEQGEPGADASCPSLLDYLEEAGAQSWELVAVDPETVGTAVLYFKRARLG